VGKSTENEETMTSTWSILVEVPLVADDDPGEAEVRLLHALEDVGAEAPVTGGGFGDTLAARFCVEGHDVWTVAEVGRDIFWAAVSKAGLKVDEPLGLEVMPVDHAAMAYGVAAALR
jgi:hypothetical protein